MTTSRIEFEYKELNQLRERYSFLATYFDYNNGVIRVQIPFNFKDSGMDGRVRELDAFYLEIHYPKKSFKSPQVYVPTDTFLPEELKKLCSERPLVTPSFFNRIFRSDPYKSRLRLEGNRQNMDAAGLLETIFGELRLHPANGRSPPPPKPRKRAFKIISIEGQIEAVAGEKPRGAPLSDSIANDRYDLYIERPALNKICNHIGWAERTAENKVEQGGIYVGIPRLGPNGRHFGVIKDAIPATDTAGTSTFVEFGHDVWVTILNYVDAQKAKGIYQPDWVILGWYHTHPNSLPVYMSPTDMKTQRKLFHQDWNSALVLNPHQELLAGFHGESADLCNVYLVKV